MVWVGAGKHGNVTTAQIRREPCGISGPQTGHLDSVGGRTLWEWQGCGSPQGFLRIEGLLYKDLNLKTCESQYASSWRSWFW